MKVYGLFSIVFDSEIGEDSEKLLGLFMKKERAELEASSAKISYSKDFPENRFEVRELEVIE